VLWPAYAQGPLQRCRLLFSFFGRASLQRRRRRISNSKEDSERERERERERVFLTSLQRRRRICKRKETQTETESLKIEQASILCRRIVEELVIEKTLSE